MLPTVRTTRCGHQSNNPIIISRGPTGKNMRPADSALGIFKNSDPDVCVPGRSILRPRVPENPEFITGCSECLSFLYCPYTPSLDLDTFTETFRSAIIRNYDCEKCLLTPNLHEMSKPIIWENCMKCQSPFSGKKNPKKC